MKTSFFARKTSLVARLVARKTVFVAWLVGLVALVFAGPAGAGEVPRVFRLEVRGDPCITAESLREALAVALGHDPVDRGAAARLEVQVLAGESLGRARWRFVDAAGGVKWERTNTVTAGCGVLLREVSLSVTVAYESTAPPPAPVCDAACRAVIRAEVRAELCRKHPRSCADVDITPVLLAGGALSLGLTADPGGGAWLGGEVRFGEHFSVGLDARVLFPSRAVPTLGSEFEMTMVTFGLVPCGRYKYFLGCLTADMGMFIGGGVTAPGGALPVAATSGIGPRLAGQFPINERFGIRVFADLRFAPIRTDIPFIDTGGRWTSNIVSGLFGAGFTFE
jgi:hypothetical protein